MKDGLGKTVLARDVHEPFEFPSPTDTVARRGYQWAHKDTVLAPHPVVGRMLLVGDAERFPKALGLEISVPYLRMIKQGRCLTTTSTLHLATSKPKMKSPKCEIRQGHIAFECPGNHSYNDKDNNANDNDSNRND